MSLLKLKKIFLTVFLGLFVFLPSFAQKQEDYEWLEKHYNNVLEEVFYDYRALGKTVSFISFGDTENTVPEYSVLFSEEFMTDYIAKKVLVREPAFDSVLSQLLTLRRKGRNRDISQIKKQLKIKEWKLTESSCPIVRDLYAEFYELNLKMLSDEEREQQKKGEVTIRLHAVQYKFNAAISGGRLNLRLDDYRHPFIVWANKTRTMLDKCIEKLPRR